MTVLEELTLSDECRQQASFAPAIVGSSTVLPEHRYTQAEMAAMARIALPEEVVRAGMIERFFESVTVEERFMAVPGERLLHLGGFQDRNDLYIEAALKLGERALLAALADADLDPGEVGMLLTTSVTGIAVPSLDARLMNRIAFDPSLVRMPIFGLGCLGGAAGIARVADWLRAYPEKCAVLLAVEICSLTAQLQARAANIISCGLFGDGAAAVVMVGAEHPLASRAGYDSRPRVLGSSSTFFPDTERTMGWDIGDNGFSVVLGPDVPDIVRAHAGRGVDRLLSQHGLVRDDIGNWVIHPGGPKVIDAMEDSLGLGRGALAATREHLRSVGNLSSVSVLFLLDEHRRRYAPGDGSGPYGVLMAMGPAFCAEIVLLRFEGGLS
jgi:alkylresorcinol/alkylpyrone synthase